MQESQLPTRALSETPLLLLRGQQLQAWRVDANSQHVARTELRNAFRTFRLDRIQDYRVLTSPFPDEEGRRLNDYLSQAGSRG